MAGIEVHCNNIIKFCLKNRQKRSFAQKRCLDVRSARLYGQFSLDKTQTLQAGATVIKISIYGWGTGAGVEE